MILETGDFIVIGIYFAVTAVLGFSWARRAGKNLNEFFLSGRAMPWWVAGTGMVATTFAADTPLWVAGQTARFGIAGNWLWWSQAMGGLLTVFFFARLWRRSGALTDLELIEMRYSGASMKFLRAFKSVYFGIFMNALILAWVNLALHKIVGVLFPEINATAVVIVCALLTAAYVASAGLWGVAIADMFQFVMAMAGSAIIAYFAWKQAELNMPGGMSTALQSSGHLNFFPEIGSVASPGTPVVSGGEVAGVADDHGIRNVGYALSWPAFIAFATVQWWSSWYPGNEPGGGGYIAQRIMSARDEKHGFFAALWFVIAHYVIRSWPWIIAALCALVLYPNLAPSQREESYVYLIRDLAPSPFRGLLFAAFLGAYMSTISTQLNWGAGYIVNDLYRRFIDSRASQKKLIAISRVSIFVLVAFSLWVTFNVIGSIAQAWEILIECGAGTGFVLILRWYWQKPNAQSELYSMLASAFSVVFLRLILPEIVEPGSAFLNYSIFPYSLFIITGLNIIISLLTMSLTKPTEIATLEKFYRRIRPPGPGWSSIRLAILKDRDSEAARDILSHKKEALWPRFMGWASGAILVYSGIFAVGSFFLGGSTATFYYLLAVVLSGSIMIYALRCEFKTY